MQVFHFDIEKKKKIFAAYALSRQGKGIARIKGVFFMEVVAEDDWTASKKAGRALPNISAPSTFRASPRNRTRARLTSQGKSRTFIMSNSENGLILVPARSRDRAPFVKRPATASTQTAHKEPGSLAASATLDCPQPSKKRRTSVTDKKEVLFFQNTVPPGLAVGVSAGSVSEFPARLLKEHLAAFRPPPGISCKLFSQRVARDRHQLLRAHDVSLKHRVHFFLTLKDVFHIWDLS